MRAIAVGLLALSAYGDAAMGQALPPDLLNYQGVLRDAADVPRSGAHDMILRLFTSSNGIDPLLIDSHTAVSGGPVSVNGGLFAVQLGGGAVSDGSAPGVYTSLSQVFRDTAYVYLELQVGSEVLSPRVRVVSAPYALNAGHLAGRSADWFLNTSSAAQTKLGPLTLDNAAAGYGLDAVGPDGGGYFSDADSTGLLHAGHGDLGVRALGNDAGGYFGDSTASGYAYLGSLGYGARGEGDSAGGYFKDRDNSGYAYLGRGDRGIEGYGNSSGGTFSAVGASGYVHAGYGGYGVEGHGNSAGGYMQDRNGSGNAFLGYGDRGIEASGNTSGGYFHDLDGIGYAHVASGNTGIEARGRTAGGYFGDDDSSGFAYVGYDDRGIYASGNTAGGYFADANSSGYAYVAYGDYGVRGYGNSTGGYFEDLDASGYAYVGSGDWGILAYGSEYGAGFCCNGPWGDQWTRVAHGSYKIRGTGTVSFVQNHPHEKDRVIVYAAPEGDEVAVSTRGTARTRHGMARVELGETFALVANPDIGLTAHVAPRGDAVPLAVASLTSRELVVRTPADAADIVFDYLIYGLRIGFEEVPIVQEKKTDAPVPSMAHGQERHEKPSGKRRVAAQERPEHTTETVTGANGTVPGPDAVSLRSTRLEIVAPVRVTEPVEPGDVLVVDALAAAPASMKRGTAAGDPAVIGIVVSADPEFATDPNVVPVALAGVAPCKVDAGYGPISAGDLLAVSPTRGHAMRSSAPVPGTIVGKALEPLPSGTGVIRVLVALR